MCGRTTARHGTTLIADERPWGNNPGEIFGELWAVCLECGLGLRTYLRSLKIRPETLRKITSYESVHVRIRELLRAFGVERPAPSSLIASVAGQAGWKSRLRELRQPPFGFKIVASRWREPSGRVQSAYTLLRDENFVAAGHVIRVRRTKRSGQGRT